MELNTFRLANIRIISSAIIAISILVSCSYRIVPAYDEAVIGGLQKANEETLTLFASVSNGGSSKSLSDREKNYNSVIGKFEATRVLIQARSPSTSLFGKAQKDSPTIAVIETITEELKMMKKTDMTGRLTAFKVVGFKQAYEISIEQALTYEKALQ